ncbi:MAG: hypothetical protein EBR89_05575 [Betaproteobacteria bacterium]|nr:hypothetical protein [Betaproteobacteria bacterium]
MSEPQVIRSGAAHEVSVAPGSTVAKSHVAAPRETVIRQNPVVDAEYVAEGDLTDPKALSLGQPKPDAAAREKLAVAQNRGRLFTAEPTAPPPAAVAQDEADEPEPEMNFPARLIHLHMENEKMRAVLDDLEHTLEAP